MSTATATIRKTEKSEWISTVIAGGVGAVVFGVLAQLVAGNAFVQTVAALYGMQGVGVGWALHILHGMVLALLFPAFVSRFSNPLVGTMLSITQRFDFLASAFTPIVTRYGYITATLSLGYGYGVAVWIVGSVVVMPLWLNAMGISIISFPYLDLLAFFGHLIYGAVLGAVYGFLVQEVF